MSKTAVQKWLDRANIRNRDMLLFLALRFIHEENLEQQFIEYLENVKKEVKG